MPSLEEPRSFAPRARKPRRAASDSGGGEAVKFDPVPQDGHVTNEALGKGVNQLHLCFEDEKKRSRRHRSEMRRMVRGVMAEQALLNQAMLGRSAAPPAKRGKPAPAPPRQTPKIGGMSTWQAGWRIAVATGSGLAGVGVLYRIGAAIWPYAWGALVTVLHMGAAGRI